MCNWTRVISGDPVGKSGTSGGHEGRGPMEDTEDMEHNGQAVRPPGGPREHCTPYLARSMGHGLGARGPVRNITATDRR